jgi:topoisomerase IV subunit B
MVQWYQNAGQEWSYRSVQRNINGNPIMYPIIQMKDEDFECAFTHSSRQYGEEYYSFVNGQHTTQGGTHQAAFREASG